MWGTHLDDVKAGRCFVQAATPLGLAVPIYTATALAGGMPIWNPANSGVEVELLRLFLPYGSGTAVFGPIGLMIHDDTVGGVSVWSAFAETTPKGLYFGAGKKSRVKSSNAGTVTLGAARTAGDWVYPCGSINLEAATGTAHGTIVPVIDFDGTVLIRPGQVCWVACQQASVALYATAVAWKEYDAVSP